MEFQSKGADVPLSREYTLQDVPCEVLWDANRHSPIRCHECKDPQGYVIDIYARKLIDA